MHPDARMPGSSPRRRTWCRDCREFHSPGSQPASVAVDAVAPHPYSLSDTIRAPSSGALPFPTIPEDAMNKRKLNPDDFAVETFVVGRNPLSAGAAAASPTVWTTCSPTCDTTILATSGEAA
jgi:hypothetical protein